MIHVNHITKYYNDHIVLDDIHFNVESSSIVGLAGPSGSGKSTLLRCIQGLEKIDKGNIECNANIGYMFQDFQLFPHMTVLQNLVYAPKIKSPHKQSFDDEALLLLDNLGLANKAKVYPKYLSGGQKQRVALARSLMMKPNVLLCDEPTSGLDIAMISDVVSLLYSIKEMNVTMIIASHDLVFLEKISERILLLKNGKIVADIETKTTPNAIEYLKSYY